jgi:hypothetical protein
LRRSCLMGEKIDVGERVLLGLRGDASWACVSYAESRSEKKRDVALDASDSVDPDRCHGKTRSENAEYGESCGDIGVGGWVWDRALIAAR